MPPLLCPHPAPTLPPPPPTPLQALNNSVVPALSGSKQLKMRYKPANDGPGGRWLGRLPLATAAGRAPRPQAGYHCWPGTTLFCRHAARATLSLPAMPPLSASTAAGKDGGVGGDEAGRGASATPSRHLWLGNITQKPSDEAVLAVFTPFGKVDSGE